MTTRPKIETTDGRIIDVGCLPAVAPRTTRSYVWQLIGHTPDVAVIATTEDEALEKIISILSVEKLVGSKVIVIKEL